MDSMDIKSLHDLMTFQFFRMCMFLLNFGILSGGWTCCEIYSVPKKSCAFQIQFDVEV